MARQSVPIPITTLIPMRTCVNSIFSGRCRSIAPWVFGFQQSGNRARVLGKQTFVVLAASVIMGSKETFAAIITDDCYADKV